MSGIKIKFDCNGFNAPAYSCSKSGDNSGYYVQSTDYDNLTQQVAELRAALSDVLVEYQELGGFEVLIDQCNAALKESEL